MSPGPARGNTATITYNLDETNGDLPRHTNAHAPGRLPARTGEIISTTKETEVSITKQEDVLQARSLRRRPKKEKQLTVYTGAAAILTKGKFLRELLDLIEKSRKERRKQLYIKP